MQLRACGPMEEKRHNQRIRTLKAGKIIYNRGLFAVDCMVKNISGTGACLVTSTASLPDKFELKIPIDHLSRQCEVAWKTLDKVGVKFIEAA
jgi:hypothetical protein